VTSLRVTRIVTEIGPDLTPDEALKRLCECCAAYLAVSSAGVALILQGEHMGSLCASGGEALAGEELQFTLGEGPCLDAHNSGYPVLEPRLAETTRWAAFGRSAVEAGLQAVFAFPMQIGPARFGALNLYRDTPGWLPEEDQADTLVLADVATDLVLAIQADAPPGWLPAPMDRLINHRAVVHQAVGMITVQLAVTIEDAHVALRAKAFVAGRSVMDVARDVVERRLVFKP